VSRGPVSHLDKGSTETGVIAILKGQDSFKNLINAVDLFFRKKHTGTPLPHHTYYRYTTYIHT
jgi:hypothetical protein